MSAQAANAKPVSPGLLVLQRDLLLDAAGNPDEDALEALAELLPQARLLLYAPRPERWRPSRRNLDQALALQHRLAERLARFGLHLDGVQYLPAGFFSTRRDQAACLRDCIRRFGEPESVVLISADPQDDALAAAAEADFVTTEETALRRVLRRLAPD